LGGGEKKKKQTCSSEIKKEKFLEKACSHFCWGGEIVPVLGSIKKGGDSGPAGGGGGQFIHLGIVQSLAKEKKRNTFSEGEGRTYDGAITKGGGVGFLVSSSQREESPMMKKGSLKKALFWTVRGPCGGEERSVVKGNPLVIAFASQKRGESKRKRKKGR